MQLIILAFLVTVVPTQFKLLPANQFLLSIFIFSVLCGKSVVPLRYACTASKNSEGREEILHLAKVPLAPEIDVCLGEFCSERNLLQLSELMMMLGHAKLLSCYRST